MIGQVPNCEAFQDMFPWPDAVTEIQPDGSDGFLTPWGFRIW